MADEDLLRPSLSDTAEVPSLYGSSGFFLVSFFAGPAAAGAYGFANSYRLGRWKQDLPLIVAAVAASFWLLLFAQRQGALVAFAELMDARLPRATQIAVRILGLACFAAIYLMHRRQYRAAAISGAEPLPGWVPGITAFVVGMVANAGVLALMKGPH